MQYKNEIQSNDNFSEKEEDIIPDFKSNKKKKKKKKKKPKNPLDIDGSNSEIKKRPKTPKIKRVKGGKKVDGKKPLLKGKGLLYLQNLGKRILINNKKQIDLTKSTILKYFSTKNVEKKETDYEVEKNDDNDNTINNNDSKIIEEENKEIKKNNLSKSFANLLIQIDNLDYKGYNYVLKKSDYFKRRPNDEPISTILNSEDAAIKKCEEIMNSLNDTEYFIDPDFGPQKNDNGRGNKKSILGETSITKILGKDPNEIDWYRIKDINENATFFYDGVESNDVIQGELGDCWFISALSLIATKDYLLRGEFNKNILEDGKIDEEEIKMMSEGIYPPIFHSFAVKGIYCFRFFKNLKWRYVIIDDRIPCYSIRTYQPKKFLFGHCRQNNEFWVALIEKAYAKINGSYFDLISGTIDEALVDMTGLVSKKILLYQELRENKAKMDELWNTLKNISSLKLFEDDIYTQSGKKVSSKYYTRNKSMMGCSVFCNRNNVENVVIDGHFVGLKVRHAYGILDAFEIPKPRGKRKVSRLLRIRNPWGDTEWNGKWCDNSEEVIKNKDKIEKVLKKKYADTNEKFDFSKNDGAFLMCFKDFRTIFNQIFLCQDFPPNIIGVRFYDEWKEENSGGLPLNNTKQEYIDFYRNPQYYIEIKKSGKIIINLYQEDARLVGKKSEQYNKRVCILLFKAKNEEKLDNFNDKIALTKMTLCRVVTLEYPLKQGSYIVIPSCVNKGDCASFTIEFYFEDILLSNTKKNRFNFNQLKYTKIKRLGESVKCELINEYIPSEVEMVSKNKYNFIISAFQYSLKNEIEINNQKNKINLNYFDNTDDDNDIDYKYEDY